MNLDVEKAYLTEVLGLKVMPQGSLQQGSTESFEADTKSLFGVFVKDLSGEKRSLLEKMLAAIGVSDFHTLSTEQEFSKYTHILDFSEAVKSFSKEELEDTVVWHFSTLESFINGSPTQVTANKKQAWELLKRFRGEVL